MNHAERQLQHLKRHVWINYALIMSLFAGLIATLIYVIRFAESTVQTNERLLELTRRVDSLDAEGGLRE